MSDNREKINNLIIDADKNAQLENFEQAFVLFKQAKGLAQSIGWNERVGQINQMIIDLQKNIARRNKEILRKEKMKEKEIMEKQKLEELISVKKKIESEQEIQKKEKIRLLKEKKMREEQLSNHAYNVVEQASEAIQMKDFDRGITDFKRALEIFTELNWKAEMDRINEFLQDAFKQKKKWELQQTKIQKKQEIEQKFMDSRKKELELEKINATQKQKFQSLKRRRIEEESQSKENIFNNILSEIEEIEKKVTEYEDLKKKIGILNIPESIYVKAIQKYLDASKKLKEIEYYDQSKHFYQGSLNYKEKELQDKKLRQIEEQKKKKGELEQINLQKKIEKSYQLEKEKELQLQAVKSKKIEEEKVQQQKALEILDEIHKIDHEIKNYEKNSAKYSFSSPYPAAIKKYQQAFAKLTSLNWIMEATRLKEGIELYTHKHNKDLEQRKFIAEKEEKENLAQEELKKKIELEQQQKEQELNLSQKKKLEKERSEQEKNAIAEQILHDIENIEEIVKQYETNPNRLLVNPPYSDAIHKYREGFEKFMQIGWIQQAKLFEDSIHKYEKKKMRDQKLREQYKQIQEETILTAEKLANEAEQSKKYHQELQRKMEKMRLKEQQKEQEKAHIAELILNEIQQVENEVKLYETNPNRLTIQESPYPQIIAVLQKSIQKFHEIGWNVQAERLKEGILRYEEKLTEDNKLRQLRKLKDQKSLELAREIEEKAQKSKQFFENMQQQIREQQEEEKLKVIRQEEIANKVLDNIDSIEQKVKDYETNPNRYTETCPYQEIIEVMKRSIPKLAEIGWNQQAERLKDGILRYQEKLNQDNKIRKIIEKKQQEKERQEKELQKLSERAKKKQEEEQKRLEEIRRQEFLEQEQKETIAKKVFNQIDDIETQVKNYESNPDRLSTTCPYSEAIVIYKRAAENFREIEWNEEANRMMESVEVYEDKLEKDRKIRQIDQKKKDELKKEKEEFIYKQKIAKKLQELKLRKLNELRQQEIEKSQQEQKIINEVYSNIDQIELEVKEYEKNPDKFFLSPPYQKAIDIYQHSIDQLKRINWDESTNHFIETIDLYKNKIVDDNKYREDVIAEQQKLEEHTKKLEEQALKAQQKLKKMQELKEHQKQQEIAQKEKQETIANHAYNLIESIESKVQAYEQSEKKLEKECPYPSAIETYEKAYSLIKGIGWIEQADRINESIELYYQKKYHDDLERKKLKIQEFRSKKEKELLERKLELEKQLEIEKQAEIKKIEDENLKKLHEEEKKSKVAFQLIDEGNNFARFHNYDEAIVNYEKAAKILNSIQWHREAEKLGMQILLFNEEKDAYERHLREEAERKLHEKREMEELERKARITAKIKQKQKELADQKALKEKILKEKQQKAEIAQIIQQSQEEELLKIKNQEEQLTQRLKEEENERKIHSECEQLLDKAKELIQSHQLESALELYKEVISKYRIIDFTPGLALTEETIQKVKRDHEIYLENLRKQEELENQRKAESERLELLISQSLEMEEKNRLKKQQREILEQKELSQKNQIQMQIINLLQDAGNYRKNNSFNEAIAAYNNALQLLKNISWPLKYDQITELIQTTKQDQQRYELRSQKDKEIEERKKKEQEEFNKLIQKQEGTRKEEIIENITAKDSEIIESPEKQLQTQSYKLLELAENCINAKKYYLSLYYFHYALLNFRKLKWNREVEITKKRLIQVFHDFKEPLLDFNDLLTNTSLPEELEICTGLTEIMRFRRYRDYSKIYEKIEYVKIYLSLLNWKSSLQKVKKFEEEIKKLEKEQYIEEERKKKEPSYEKALEMVVNSEKYNNSKNYEKAFKLAETAKNMFDYLNLTKQSHELEIEILIWKYNAEKETSKSYLSDEERRIARIENRKRKRRSR